MSQNESQDKRPGTTPEGESDKDKGSSTSTGAKTPAAKKPTGAGTKQRRHVVPEALRGGKAPKVGDRKRYVVGVLTSCPFHSLHLGGVCFPQRSEINPIMNSPSQRVNKKVLQGAVVELFEEEVDKVFAGTANRVLRWRNASLSDGKQQRKADVKVCDGRYTVQPEDEPIARYVYFIPEDEANELFGDNWRMLDPGSHPIQTMEEMYPA